MIELKKKALGGIKEMLEDRLSSRMRPKSAVPGEDGPRPMASEPGESQEHEEAELEKGVLPEEGGESSGEVNIEALSPEEQEQLSALLEKAGC